nr:MAG TPA: hypothetical protein [Siphoviridae sp. ct7Ev5]DAO21037.1 MAG TPA: hypothetical protein [Caudoviricetes sp.]
MSKSQKCEKPKLSSNGQKSQQLKRRTKKSFVTMKGA